MTRIADQRAIIDRRSLAGKLAVLTADGRDEAAALLKDALRDGRAEIAQRLEAKPSAGLEAATAHAFLIDQIVRLTYDYATTHLCPLHNPTAGERIALVAVGGYGRGEMAPFSDVDLAFVTPYKPTGWTEQVIESILYLLWDLGLKIGHASRSLDVMIRTAKKDQTVRTAVLEARYVWGDRDIFDMLAARFRSEVLEGQVKQFVREKIEERDARHERMGDTRYVVEPNVKEGKGALRDLHALYWIGKYAFAVQSVPELVDAGLLTRQELSRFRKAENFLWAVRCHLHILARRAEERLTFDYQREIAARMNYADRPGHSAVERFMRHYFLHARAVGDLTGLFLAHLDERFAKRGRRVVETGAARRPRKLDGFVLDRGRLALPHAGFLAEQPLRLMQMFALADRYGLDIHPLAMRAAAHDARLIDAHRDDPFANAYFLDVLTSPRDPAKVLRWMNEAGLFGRFMPDFGRVVARMQFDMYHHYTVDEHTIRAIGLLSRIEKGELKQDHPLSSALIHHIASRRVLYVAVLLHDIAKGRGGDHSILGAEVAEQLCPRLGLDPTETEMVAWLVRWHLLMSATAFKRDLADPKTIADFVGQVQSLERLRLLLILTVVDIRAVGPDVWNDWKRQLLRQLFDAAEEMLRLGHKQRDRSPRVAALKAALGARLGWPKTRFARYARRLPDSYWLAEPEEVQLLNAEAAGAGDANVAIHVRTDWGATLLTVHTPDRPGLFYRVAGAISLAGGNIIDARVHTTADGMALDNFLLQDASGAPFADPHALARLEAAVDEALAGVSPDLSRLEARPASHARASAFIVRPAVFVDDKASNRYTVIEVNARDRAALLSSLTRAIFESKAMLHSAHIATYGERAVDVFYVTDRKGAKLSGTKRLDMLKQKLLEAAA